MASRSLSGSYLTVPAGAGSSRASDVDSASKKPNLLVSLATHGTSLAPLSSGPVLLVADLFHPVHRLAIELFLNGDVRHGGGWRGTVPMLLTRWDPDPV